jgi:hypothetical protein
MSPEELKGFSGGPMECDLAEWFEECLIGYHLRVPMRWKHSQKRRAIELMLRSNPHISDRSLSAKTGFSRELISKIREGMPAPEYRLGLDGKRYRSL